MAQPHEKLKAALSVASRLPSKLQRELAERLLTSSAPDQTRVTVFLRKLPQAKQRRLAKLLDNCSEGTLTKSEQEELQRLGREVDETVLSNSLALARAARPELFDAKGRLIRSRFRSAFGIAPNNVPSVRRKNLEP